MNIKDYLREKVEKLNIDFYNLPYEIQYEIENWPEIEDEDNVDPLHCENFEWISIDDDEMIISCCGDWQEPKTLTIKMEDKILSVTNIEDGMETGMSEEEFYEIIGAEYQSDNEDYYDYDPEDEDY